MKIIAEISASVQIDEKKHKTDIAQAKSAHASAIAPRVAMIGKATERLQTIQYRKKNPIPAGTDERQLLNLSDIDVGAECLESYPCQHDVTIQGKVAGMDGHEIAQLYRSNFLPVPSHFAEY